MNDEIVSVIVPIYNVEKYLSDCLNSIINQTYKNLEIILVDDGSTDESSTIANYYSKKDKRIKVFHKKNGGLSDARNFGIEKANGKYLLFVDSDDFIEVTMIEELINSINEFHSDISVCGRYIYSNEIIDEKHSLKEKKIYNTEDALKEVLLGKDMEEATWDKLYKKELFEDIRFPIGEINEDIVTIPLVIGKAKIVSHVGKPLYYYRYNPTGISKSAYSEKKNIIIPHLKFLGDYINKEFPNLRLYFNMCEYRYSYSLLLSLCKHKDIKKKYSKEYKTYKKMFRKNYILALTHKHFTINEFIKSLLIFTNLYGLVWKFKHKEV